MKKSPVEKYVELKKSNDNNKRPLGGSVSSRLSEEDDKDDNNYDVQMEKIMARFTNFNQILSSGGSQEEDDDDEEDEATQDSGDKNDDGFDEDDDDNRISKKSYVFIRRTRQEMKEVFDS